MPRQQAPSANLLYENQIYAQGLAHVVGFDEAGRGPWAGPVSAAAVCLPLGRPKLSQVLKGVRDSKEMTPLQRANTVDLIKDTALAWGIGSASSGEIDALGIVPATLLAMQRALDWMRTEFPGFAPECLFLDALVWPAMLGVYPQVAIVDGDARSLSIAAASVLAKVWRDAHMTEVDAHYPQYGFAAHKGYGTAAHAAALKLHGPCPTHRLSFAPVRELAEEFARR